MSDYLVWETSDSPLYDSDVWHFLPPTVKKKKKLKKLQLGEERRFLHLLAGLLLSSFFHVLDYISVRGDFFNLENGELLSSDSVFWKGLANLVIHPIVEWGRDSLPSKLHMFSFFYMLSEACSGSFHFICSQPFMQNLKYNWVPLVKKLAEVLWTSEVPFSMLCKIVSVTWPAG